MAENKKAKKAGAQAPAIKRCPHCGAYLKQQLTRCDACHRRVGPSDAHGIAKKPVDWRAYATALIAVAVFCGFLYWMSTQF